MTTNWNATEVDVAGAGPDFWARYHTYRRLRHQETRPGDPITPDHVVEGDMKRVDPYDLHFRYEIAAGGQMLSWFSAGASRPGSPGFESNKHLLWADWSVHPDHRRQGIGRSWIPLVLEIMARNSYTTVGIGTEEASGHAAAHRAEADEAESGGHFRLEDQQSTP